MNLSALKGPLVYLKLKNVFLSCLIYEILRNISHIGPVKFCKQWHILLMHFPLFLHGFVSEHGIKVSQYLPVQSAVQKHIGVKTPYSNINW